MDYTKEQIENIINDMFPGLTFFYRDADLPDEVVQKYEHRQIIRNGIFLDASSLGGKLTKNTRFLIASNKASPLFQINPDVAKWRLHTINVNTYFQVLDIIRENGKTQILLIQIPKDAVSLFQSSWINLLDSIIEKGKESFELKKSMEPITALEEDEWIKRTEYPIGMNANNEFFQLFPSNQSQSNSDEKAVTQTKINQAKVKPSPTTKIDDKKKTGFWNKLFRNN